MSLATTIVLAIALAMDCFAISIAIGLKEKAFNTVTVIKTSTAFGLFQAIMPLIGWFSIIFIHDYIERYSPWIAFAMLGFIGAKMVIESLRGEEHGNSNFDISNWFTLIWLAIATSIDALAAGISYSAMGVNITMPAIIIGLFSSTFSIAGIAIGAKLGDIFGNKAETIGGLILIGLGLKILLENIL